MARTGITRQDPDYFIGIVANSVLSGYSGRLNQEIRIKRGLELWRRKLARCASRDWTILGFSANEKSLGGGGSRTLLMREIERFSSEPVPDIEMTPRKAVVIGNFARNLETAAGLVSQVGSLALYGIGFDEINRYIGNVQAITAQRRAAICRQRDSAQTIRTLSLSETRRSFCRRCGNSFRRWK